jgi:hypothetical protein
MLETELERFAGAAENAPTEALLSNRTRITWPWRPPCPAELVPNRVVMQ